MGQLFSLANDLNIALSFVNDRSIAPSLVNNDLDVSLVIFATHSGAGSVAFYVVLADIETVEVVHYSVGIDVWSPRRLWYPIGSLLPYVSSWPSHRFRVIMDLARIIASLHLDHNVHGEIYPGNFLICEDGMVAIVGAGLYTAAQHILPRVPLYLSSRYKSREELSMDEVPSPTAAMDTYGWAISAFAIFSGDHPFPSLMHSQAVVEICLHGHTRLSKPSNMDDGLWSVLQKCLQDPIGCPTMQNVMVELSALQP